MEFQDYIERLKTTFISEAYADEIRKAKGEFIALGGELANEVYGNEELLKVFFDWYIFDRPLAVHGITPLMLFLNDGTLPFDEKDVYSGFAKFIHSIFTIKKGQDNITVLDIFTKSKYSVQCQSSLLEKGEMVEARLLMFKGAYRFSDAYCFFPADIHPIINAKAKEARKSGMRDFSLLIQKFRTLKTMWGRCSNMDIKKVYTLMEEGLIA